MYEKINDQKVANFFVTLFTAIGTLATIFYTNKQYKLSELVNRTSIKPEIYPQTYHFKMEDEETPLEIDIGQKLFLTHAISFEPENVIDSDDDKDLKIKNIGVGIAKNVEYRWIFNESEVKELIKEVYYLTPDSPQIPIPYLHPGNSISITLPSRYLSCCGPKLIEKFGFNFFSNKRAFILPKVDENLQKDFLKIIDESYGIIRPKLSLEISYTDVQDFLYKKVFDTKVTGIDNVVVFEFEQNNN